MKTQRRLEINVIASHGGFKYKEWTGIFWNVSKDEFYSSRLDISVGGKKVSKKINLRPYLGGDNTLPLSKTLLPISLTIRIRNEVWIIKHRWHQKQRSLKIGDICLLQDPNAIVIVPAEETDKKKEVTCHESQVTSQEIVLPSYESQVTSQETGGGVTKMRSQ